MSKVDGQGQDRSQQSTIQFGDGPPIPVGRWELKLDPAASGQCRGVAGRWAETWDVHPKGKFYVALDELRRYAAARGVKA